jgi:hypothetical protein
MRGLYATAAQHEANGGPLAPVGPVVRAAVRFAEPLEDEQADQQQSRRIQVRASVRKAPTSIESEGNEPLQRAPRQAPSAAAQIPADQSDEPVRRSISVRRVEPPAPEATAEPSAEPQQSAPAPKAAPVRRIAVNRADQQPIGSTPRVVSYNGNGVHRSDEDEA